MSTSGFTRRWRLPTLGVLGLLMSVAAAPVQSQTASILDCPETSFGSISTLLLGGRGYCLHHTPDTRRGWVFADPGDRSSLDQSGPFDLPLISVTDSLEILAEAQSLGVQESDKFYIVSEAIANGPPAFRPTLPHPEVLGPFSYGLAGNPVPVTLDLTTVLDLQALSPNNLVVVLQHEPGFDFNNPGVESFDGMRFEEADNPVVRLSEVCPDINLRGGFMFDLELTTNRPTQDLTGYKVRFVGNDGFPIGPDTVLNGTASNGLFTVPANLGGVGSPAVFGVQVLDLDTNVVDSATFAEEGGMVSAILSQILDNPSEPGARLSLEISTAWFGGEKPQRSNVGAYHKPKDCGQENRLFAINEFDLVDADGGAQQQFIEIFSSPNTSLDGLVLKAFTGQGSGDPETVAMSFDLDNLSTNAQGYAVVSTFPNFAGITEDTDFALGIYELDDPFPAGSNVSQFRQTEYEYDIYTRRSPNSPEYSSKLANENGNGHPERDSLQFCEDASSGVFPDAPMPAPPTLGAVNNCEVPPDTGATTNANTPDAAVVSDPINAATGEFYTTPIVDIDLGGPLPLRFVRRYAAFLSDDGRVASPLGPNWMHDFELQLTLPDSETIEIIYFGGQVLRFTRDAGTGDWQLTAPLKVPFQLKLAGNQFRLMDPSRNRVYAFGNNTAAPVSFGRLESIEDRNGNRLDIAYQLFLGGSRTIDTITDSLGRTLTFSYTNTELTGLSDGIRTLSFGYTGGNLTAATDALGQTTSYQYDTSTSHGPLLTAIVRPEGNAPFTQTYDSNGRVSQQQDAFGSPIDIALDTPEPGQTTVTDLDGSTVFDHDPFAGAAIEVQDRSGESARIGYDAASRPTALFDRNTGMAQGVTRRSHHPESGKLASLTDAEGNTTTFSYQLQTQTFGAGAEQVSFNFYNLVQIDYADGNNLLFLHDASGNVITFLNPLGVSTSLTYNNQGLRTAIQGPDGGILSLDYNADGTLRSRADGASDDTLYEYDALKRLIRILPPQTGEPAPPEITISYDARDRITSITDARGQQTSYTYDGNDNLIAVQDPDGQTTQYNLDLLDEVNMITNRLGATRTRTFDALRRLASTIDADGITTQYGYNQRDDLTSITVGLSTLQIGYDNEGIPAFITSPLSNTTAFESDRLGQITAVIDPLGARTEFDYDARGRMQQVRSADNRRRSATFNAQSALVAVEKFDASDNPTGSAAYAYSAAGLLSGITDLNGEQWSFVNTPEGRVQSQTDPLAQTISYVHDARGRISQINFPDGGSRSFTHDANGNVTRIDHSGSLTLDYSFDNLNRLTSTDELELTHDAEGAIVDSRSNGVDFGASYTAAGQLASVSYNNDLFQVNYVYNPITGLLDQVSDSLTGTVLTLVHDLDRRLIRIERSNDTETAFSYDAANRLVGITGTNTQTATTYLDLQYSLDAVGHVTDLVAITPLTLDSSLFTLQTQDYAVDAASQISSSGFAYDSRGRQTASPGNSLSWDEGNRLTQLNAHAFTYNGLGDPVTHTASTSQRYHYNAALVGRPMVAEQNASGDFDRYYVFSPSGLLLYLIDAGDGNAVQHFDFDRVGSTQVLTDESGAVSNAYAYLPFGELLAQTGSSTQPFTFGGQYGIRQLDEVGRFYQMRARVYDAQTASFLSREPLWPLIANPDLLNPYQFAFRNPLSVVDATGLFGLDADDIRDFIARRYITAEQVFEELQRARRSEATDKGFVQSTFDDLFPGGTLESFNPGNAIAMDGIAGASFNAVSNNLHASFTGLNHLAGTAGQSGGNPNPQAPATRTTTTVSTSLPELVYGYTRSVIKQYLQAVLVIGLYFEGVDVCELLQNENDNSAADAERAVDSDAEIDRESRSWRGPRGRRFFDGPPPPPLRLDEPVGPPTFDEYELEELGDGDCTL